MPRLAAGGPPRSTRLERNTDMTTASNTEKKGRIEMMKRIAVAGLILAALASARTVGAQAGPTAIPDTLAVPSGNVLLFKTAASGVQIYTCAAQADDPETLAWTFKAPEAELLNELGQTVGTHYAGPTWEGNDGSTVI